MNKPDKQLGTGVRTTDPWITRPALYTYTTGDSFFRKYFFGSYFSLEDISFKDIMSFADMSLEDISFEQISFSPNVHREYEGLHRYNDGS